MPGFYTQTTAPMPVTEAQCSGIPGEARVARAKLPVRAMQMARFAKVCIRTADFLSIASQTLDGS